MVSDAVVEEYSREPRAISLRSALFLYGTPFVLLLALALVVLARGRLPYPDQRFASWDHYKYIAMAEHPFGADPLVHDPPWCWRVLTPLIVHVLPLSVLQAFTVVTLAGLASAAAFLIWFLRGLGLPAPAAAAGSLAFVMLGPATGFTLWDYMLIDPLSFALLCLALGAVVHKQGWVLVVALVLYALNKEMAMFAAAFALLWAYEKRDVRMALWAAAGLMLSFGILIGLRFVISPAYRYSVQGAVKYVFEMAMHDPGIVPARLVAASASTWNILLPLSALQLIHTPRVWRSPSFCLLLVLALVQVLASVNDVERLVVYGFPVVIAACVFEIEYLSVRFRMPRWMLWTPILLFEFIWWLPFTQDRTGGPLYIFQLTGVYFAMAMYLCLGTLAIIVFAVRREPMLRPLGLAAWWRLPLGSRGRMGLT